VVQATFYAIVSLTFFAYVRVVTADPGRPCGLESPHMLSGRAANGKEMRMCQKCKTYKPERCHHCSDCNQCTLKMGELRECECLNASMLQSVSH